MKVGLMLPTMQSVELNEQFVLAAEQLGVDDLWMPDHLLGVMHPVLWRELAAASQIADSDSWLDPFCLAAILGRQTEKTLGICVTDATRRRAADLARTTLMLNSSCRGDFVLGVGSGEAESLLPFGYDFSKPVGRLEETLFELRSLLDTGRMPGDGIGRTGLPLSGSNGKALLWVAAVGDRALELAGRYGDAWLSTGAMTPEEFSQKRTRVNDAAAAAARPAPTTAMFPMIMLGESREHLIAAVDQQPLVKLLTLFGPAALWQRYGLHHPTGPNCRGIPDAIPHQFDPEFLRSLAYQIPFAMLEDFLMLGNVEDIARQLQPFADAGMNHVILADLTGIVHPPQKALQLMGEMKDLIEILHHF